MEYFVSEVGTRPDFRLVITVLFGPDVDAVDSDGDAHHPASREWTDLYCYSRVVKSRWSEIEPDSRDPLVLAIRSDSPDLAALAALFMSDETNGKVTLDRESSKPVDRDTLIEACATLEPLDRLEASKESVWRRATLDNPYPNRNP